MSHNKNHAPSARTIIKQAPKRAGYDRATINRIIDDALIATVAVSIDDEPFVLPMAVARIGDYVYLHGSRTSRLMKHMAAGHLVCLNITHMDGIVVARSTMHCSANYRSVMIHAKAQVVDEDRKADLLYQVAYQLIPGSQGDYREHLAKELKATTLIEVPLDESVCKVRTGGPIDDESDLDLPYWAGVIPIRQVYDAPMPADNLQAGMVTPDYALNYARPQG